MIWNGPTSDGLDLIEKLRALAKLDNSMTTEPQNNQKIEINVNRYPTENVLKNITIGVFIVILSAIIIYLIREHIGINLQ